MCLTTSFLLLSLSANLILAFLFPSFRPPSDPCLFVYLVEATCSSCSFPPNPHVHQTNSCSSVRDEMAVTAAFRRTPLMVVLSSSANRQIEQISSAGPAPAPLAQASSPSFA